MSNEEKQDAPSLSRMSLENITTGPKDSPFRIVVYGVDGIGKTSFAAGADGAIFLPTEKGTEELDVARFPLAENTNDVYDAIQVLMEGEHKFKTLVVDTVDWLEHLMREEVANLNGVDSVDEIPYGKGKPLVVERMMRFLRALDALYSIKGMNIILLAHTHIKGFRDPQNDEYDRYQLKVFDTVADKIREWADAVMFANYDTTTLKKGEGFRERNIGASFDKRFLYTQRQAAFDAKNRYNLPQRMELSWQSFIEAYNNRHN